MGALLDEVSINEWREVVRATVAAAKVGDTAVRNFLAQYSVGRPDLKAPSPVTVVVQQLSGRDPLIDKLAAPNIVGLEWPDARRRDRWNDGLRDDVAAELRTLAAQHADSPNSGETVDATKGSAASDAS